MHHLLSFRPACFRMLLEGSGCERIIHMARNRNPPRSLRVFILSVTSPGCYKVPSLGLYSLYDFPDFHSFASQTSARSGLRDYIVRFTDCAELVSGQGSDSGHPDQYFGCICLYLFTGGCSLLSGIFRFTSNDDIRETPRMPLCFIRPS